MTTDEMQAVMALVRCTFLPGSWDKRFVRALGQHARDTPLSDKQREWLWKLVWKYRRQIPYPSIVEQAHRAVEPQLTQAEQGVLPL